MHITLTPMRRDASLQLERAGDLLVINGEAFDFSALPDGATLPMEPSTAIGSAMMCGAKMVACI